MISPYISREDVSAALSSLIRHSREPEFNGLRHLLLVDLRLASPEMPAGDTIREYAVRDLLLTQIAAALAEQRATFNLAPPDIRANLQRVHSEILEAVEQGAHELLVWSLLYYRCARVDLDFAVDELATMLAVHERTLSRYFNDGVDLLTERLIRAEEQARRAQLERLLYASLPHSVPVNLLGREMQLQSTQSTLDLLSPRHILVTGAAGIGKTAFVQELIRRQISGGYFEHVIWIDEPESVSFVRQRLIEILLREASAISLREYLLMHSVAIILDGISRAAGEYKAFEMLLRDLSPAAVYLINQVYLPLDGIQAHVELTGIDFAAATALVEALLPARDIESAQDIAAALYEQTSGNPMALRLAVGLWSAGDDTVTIETELHGRLFTRLFDQLGDISQQAWCALALFPNPIDASILARLWRIPSSDIRILQRYGLAEYAEDNLIWLGEAAKEAVRQGYYEHITVRQKVDRLLAQLPDDLLGFELIEHALATGFPEISADRQAHWVNQLWREGFRRNHWALWRSILEVEIASSGAFAPELQVAYAMCLRRLGEWEAAEHVFRRVVDACGRQGLFAEQGRAFIEWSILARYRSDYQQASVMLAQAKRYAQRARDGAMLSEVAQHEAQLHVVQGEGKSAVALLATLPDNLQVAMLQSEAHLAIGDYAACRQFVERALRLVADDRASEASLYTTFGRSFQAEGAFQQAQPPLTDAVMLLERLDDVFSLGRAQTNLAAVLIPLGRLTDAGVLLARAEQSQLRLGDRVGLAATRHNRVFLGRQFAD